jgi:hypothetical protein
LAPGLRQVAAAQGYRFVQQDKASCMPLNGVAYTLRENPSLAHECIHFNAEVLKLLESDSHIQIVVLVARWDVVFHGGTRDSLVSDHARTEAKPIEGETRNLFVQSLRSSIQALQGAGKHVIVMDDVPEFEIDPLQKFRTAHVPPRHLLATLLGADTRESSLAPAADVTAAETASGLLKQLTASLTGVELIDLKSTLCDSRNFCRYKVGEQMLFSDKNHLSAEGARYVLRDFRLPPSTQEQRVIRPPAALPEFSRNRRSALDPNVTVTAQLESVTRAPLTVGIVKIKEVPVAVMVSVEACPTMLPSELPS